MKSRLGLATCPAGHASGVARLELSSPLLKASGIAPELGDLALRREASLWCSFRTVKCKARVREELTDNLLSPWFSEDFCTQQKYV